MSEASNDSKIVWFGFIIEIKHLEGSWNSTIGNWDCS